MLDKSGIPFEVVRISPMSYYTGIKGKLGGLPVAERHDGLLMQETHPIARYIARTNGFYPTDPLECFYCDMYSLVYDPIINTTFKWILAMGGEKKKLYLVILDKIQEALTKCQAAFRPGKWMIGDGSKIMMCDFFYGRVYTDLMINPGSFISKPDRDAILKKNPEFAQFGEKFTADNQ